MLTPTQFQAEATYRATLAALDAIRHHSPVTDADITAVHTALCRKHHPPIGHLHEHPAPSRNTTGYVRPDE